MSLLFKILGIWGLIDSLWLAINPTSWARFWDDRVTDISTGVTLPRVLALTQFLLSLYLLRKAGAARWSDNPQHRTAAIPPTPWRSSPLPAPSRERTADQFPR
jgi:hypothetical protein